MEMRGSIAHRYRAFADEAASSPCFADWARRVADDAGLHAWLADLPEGKQQPNLVFAAARWHGAEAPGEYAAMRRVLLEHEDAVKQTIRRRATQTNEVGRLATLVPVLAQVPGPVAVIEVGASAGLCLHPDRYDYDWPGRGALRGSGGPLLTATVEGPMPVPEHHPEVAWRGGVDLNPLDPQDTDAMAWLETLVWPEHQERRTRLRAAVEVAAAAPAHVVRGDLFDALPGLLAEAGRHGRPVVLHSAVVAYLDDPGRERFHDLMTGLVASGECHWISNEGPQVLPAVTATASREPVPGWFVTGLDGSAVALSHGHGHGLDWF